MNSVLVAPDSFKGTFTAVEVAAALARGLRAGGREPVELPVGDGGEGTMDALVASLDGELRTTSVSDPLDRSIDARFAVVHGGRVGIVEVAEASGLGLVEERERDAFAASTRGTGELIVAAKESGVEEVVVCVGGSATTDGGAGAIAALDEAGIEVPLVVACDVRTPWERAARVFAPQKGADAATVKRLEQRLRRLAAKAPRDPRGVAMTGAAGGLAGGLWAWRGARLLPGAPYVLDTVGFDALMRSSRWVVTGEGQIDEQTLAGKAVAEVATRCRQSGVACHAVVACERLDSFGERVIDLSRVIEARTLGELEAAGLELAEL